MRRVGKFWVAAMIGGVVMMAAGALAQSSLGVPGGTPPLKLSAQQLPQQRMPTQPLPGFLPKSTISAPLTMAGTRVEFQPRSAMAAGMTLVGNQVEFPPKSTIASGIVMVGSRIEFQPRSAIAAGMTLVGNR